MKSGTPFAPLENRVLERCRSANLRGARVLLALSGGADSVALLHIFARIRRVLAIDLQAAHVHHGYGLRSAWQESTPLTLQEEFRDRAARFCSQLCAQYDIPLKSNSDCPEALGLKNEQELREYRYRLLKPWARDLGCAYIVLAHHRDDLLETRLIRLVRGVGDHGFVAMRSLNGRLFRPLLEESRESLLSYLRQQGWEWVEDPSNQDLGPLRNWIRYHWLPELELKRPGSVNCMAASLERLALAISVHEDPAKSAWEERGINREVWLGLSVEARRQVLARYLHFLGVRNFTQGQLDEIIKRLKSPQKTLDFRVAHVDWKITAHWICAHPQTPP